MLVLNSYFKPAFNNHRGSYPIIEETEVLVSPATEAATTLFQSGSWLSLFLSLLCSPPVHKNPQLTATSSHPLSVGFQKSGNCRKITDSRQVEEKLWTSKNWIIIFHHRIYSVMRWTSWWYNSVRVSEYFLLKHMFKFILAEMFI